MKYYLMVDDRRVGPLDRAEMENEDLRADTLVWHTGASGWLRADQVPDLAEIVRPLEPVAPPQPVVPQGPGPRLRHTPEGIRLLHGWLMSSVLIGFGFLLSGYYFAKVYG